MGITVIDRRLDPQEDKFGTDRQRFLERHRDIIKKAVGDHIAKGSIRDFESGGAVIPIPKKMTSEPVVHHGQGGRAKRVFPGLMKFDVGDRIPKPPGGSGGKGNGKGDPADDGEGEEDFVWLSPEEILDMLFEGRRLPDMTKLKAPDIKIIDREHAGYTNKGPAHRLDMDITNRKRAGEALILGKMGEKRVIENLTEQYKIYASYEKSVAKLDLSGLDKHAKRNTVIAASQSLKALFQVAAANPAKNDVLSILAEAVQILKAKVGGKIEEEADNKRLQILEARLEDQLKANGNSDRYRPDHLTYEYDDDVAKPGAKAVLFCKMDVSGSMTQERKNIAKSFFWLINKFLKSKYDNVDIVFIAHTTTAEEVDEQTFFYGQEYGGTKVSSCLELEQEIIAQRYDPSIWNIYGVQASDGENSQGDNVKVTKLMKELMSIMQSYYYIQVEEPTYGEKLLPVYEALTKEFPGRLFTAELNSPADGLDAFKHFFPSDGSVPTKPSFVP